MMVTTQFFALKIQRYLHDHGLDPTLLAEVAAKALRNGADHAPRVAAQARARRRDRRRADGQRPAHVVHVLQPERGRGGGRADVDRARPPSSAPTRSRSGRSSSAPAGSARSRCSARGWRRRSPTGATVDAARAAFEAAGIGPDEIDVAQLQDTEAGAELMHLAECGFCEHGEQDRLVDDGELEIGGRLPVNTDGGLIANGEPIGASGLRQVIECVHQLRGRAGERQVPGEPRTAFTQVYGAPGISVCSVLGPMTAAAAAGSCRRRARRVGDQVGQPRRTPRGRELADATLRLAAAIERSISAMPVACWWSPATGRRRCWSMPPRRWAKRARYRSTST